MWSGGSGIAVCYKDRSSRLRSLIRLKQLKRFKRFERFKRTACLCLLAFLFPALAQAEDRLYYFWSFSMPQESIKAAFADGEKIGLVAVLRGLPEGSARESLLRLKQLLGGRKVEVVIDPLLFKLYNITAVPTTVYAEGINPSCEHCEPAPSHWKAVGDVRLEVALENLSRSAPSVEPYLQRLREGFYSK
jgi:type-F conjugative transfer system pilin assembly protein TrbC